MLYVAEEKNGRGLVMRVAISVEEFTRILNSLVGKPLWAATVTRDVQSHLSLHLGCKIRRKDRSEGPSGGKEPEAKPPVRISAEGIRSVTSDQEQYGGEWTLVVWCNWRIEADETRIACGSQDSAEEGMPMQSTIREMMGDVIKDVSLNSFLDLLIVFSSGKRLRLFCDQSGHENNEDSYAIFTAHGEMYGVMTGLIELGGGVSP
jgi:hypothetical protein